MTDRFGYGEIGLDINTRHPCEGCRDYDAPDGCKSNGGCGKPTTNADRIRSMSDEEFSHFLFGIQCAPASKPKEWLDWLRQEAEEGE